MSDQKLRGVRELLGDKYTKTFEEGFPDVDPGVIPFGYLVLLQIRTPLKKIGSLIIPDTAQDAEKWRVQTGLVRGLGPTVFKRRDTLEPWPENAWCKEGQFVRCPIRS